MAEMAPRGSFAWHDLMASDPDAATAFYKKVIGWNVVRWEHDATYRMWTMKDVPMGGITELPEDARKMGAPPHWLAYIGVPDVDEAVKQALGMGGKTFVEGLDIPNVGRIAVLTDPQGAMFAVYRPLMPGGGGDGFSVGDFSWHELATSNWKAGWEFYKALFGWQFATSFDMGAAGTYWMFRRAGGTRTLGGMYTKPPEMAAPPHWLCYVNVPNADKAAALTVKHGGRVVREPMDVPGGDRVAVLVDPQGAAFAVHAVAVKAAPAPAKPAKPAKAAKPVKHKPAARKAAKRKPAKKAAKKKPARKKAPQRAAKRKSAKGAKQRRAPRRKAARRPARRRAKRR